MASRGRRPGEALPVTPGGGLVVTVARRFVLSLPDDEPDNPDQEDTMHATLADTCPLCGLRFSNGPLLELHVRDDHRRRPALRNDRRDEGGDEEE